jgi:hypothetical protein
VSAEGVWTARAGLWQSAVLTMLHRALSASLAALVAQTLLACGRPAPDPVPAASSAAGTTTVTAPVSAPVSAPTRCGGTRGGIAIEGQMGTIPTANVRSVIAEADPRFEACFTARLEVLPVLAGRIEMKLRVAEDGAVRWAVPLQSTLGDRSVEECMLGVARGLRFEAPCGGEAEVTHQLDMDGGPDRRPATEVPAARLDVAMRNHRREIEACRSPEAALHGARVWLYLAPDGSVAAAGAPATTEAELTATQCALRALRAWRVGSPGSWYARTVVTLP